ncbi:HTH-type transcriptional regulator LutR (plasmid) [Antarctobacter heliothermus]|uniref:HTH-type transcriptional regulator LutR n=1 Tax=Antarctobacter heliothermus TaxID=74033 RepID=A0A222EBN9_9RHOB|nr:FCD domain-containing protein [Antarctobacter heliothermus]ASP23488.1 HTH-type transcriptional regulator LutR [Antarctobacter heliothermus]
MASEQKLDLAATSSERMFESSNQGKASQVIVSKIRETVDAGKLGIGDRLPQEKELIEQFGFSRAVIREALRTLEAEGLIKLVSGRNGGAEICEPDPLKFVPAITTLMRLQNTSVEEVHETLELIEPIIAEIAAERLEQEDIDLLQQSIDLMLENANDPLVCQTQSNRFHILLARATRNQMLIFLSTMIRQVIVRLEYKGVGERPKQVAEEHQRILDALKSRDGAEARQATLDHAHQCEYALKSSPTGYKLRTDATRDQMTRNLLR